MKKQTLRDEIDAEVSKLGGKIYSRQIEAAITVIAKRLASLERKIDGKANRSRDPFADPMVGVR